MIDYKDLPIDYELELEQYLDQFPKHRIRGVKLQSCSPFRDESSPSFAVNLESGLWVDSGAVDETYYKGNFYSLLAFLRGEDYDSTYEYLRSVYDANYMDIEEMRLEIDLNGEEEERDYINIKGDETFKYRSDYLNKRGISDKAQGAFKIGYDKEQKAVAIPWFDQSRNVVTVKYRSTGNKFFWYDDRGRPVKDYVYGLHLATDFDTVVVTESEIDCLYLWSNGIPAIALGGASLSKKQETLLTQTNIKEFVLAFDNDVAGDRCARQFIRKFIGKVVISSLSIPLLYNDVNEVPAKELEFLYKRRNKLELNFNYE